MKKCGFLLSMLVVVASCGGNSGGAGSKMTASGSVPDQSTSTMTLPPACNALSMDEQDFAGQIMDSHNQKMFCSQFTSQQRGEAMRMLGTSDASGNKMSADAAVKQVMKTNGMMPSAERSKMNSTGGSCCPGK